MRINERERIVGERCILVPYRECHVPKYHGWMQNDELLEATSSERLSIAAEYDMQKSWQADDDKLTFIILDVETYDTTNDEVDAMIGDVNAFLIPRDAADERKPVDRQCHSVELSVMVAEPAFRHRGVATEAIALLMLYARQRLAQRDFLAKINAGNHASLLLFERLHFHQLSYSEAFDCVTMRFDPKCFLSLKERFRLRIEPLAHG